MKKYTLPSLEVKSFNKELILQDSAVTPSMTNEEAAIAALGEAQVEVNKVAVITL